MTYRASLGTRGELRRIAAEAETATIERVRPWNRHVQACRLAPHVVVPQWIRSEHPAKPLTPPPMLYPQQTESRKFVTELLDKALDSACSDRTLNDDIDPEHINITPTGVMQVSPQQQQQQHQHFQQQQQSAEALGLLTGLSAPPMPQQAPLVNPQTLLQPSTLPAGPSVGHILLHNNQHQLPHDTHQQVGQGQHKIVDDADG